MVRLHARRPTRKMAPLATKTLTTRHVKRQVSAFRELATYWVAYLHLLLLSNPATFSLTEEAGVNRARSEKAVTEFAVLILAVLLIPSCLSVWIKRTAPVCLTFQIPSAPPIKSAVTLALTSVMLQISSAKQPVTRFHVPPIRAFFKAVVRLNPRLLTAQMVAGQDKAEGKNKDASIRVPHVQPAALRRTTVTTSTLPQIRAADQTITAKMCR